MSETLKEKTAKGMFWGGMNNGIQQLIGLVYGIILARLVAKSDFGVMAMINIFPLVANALKESGFTAALANLKNPTHRDYNSVFCEQQRDSISDHGEKDHNAEIIHKEKYHWLAVIKKANGSFRNIY